MNICIISKYPPIEGGVSSGIYWLSKALGEAGHNVYVITNALEVDDDYKERFSLDDKKFQPKRVKVYSTSSSVPFFVSYYNPHIAKLANLAVEIINKKKIDVIYSEYILPYGIAAMIAKLITSKPLILCHAGSDITRLFNSPLLHTIFTEAFKNADMIISFPPFIKDLIKHGIVSQKIIMMNKGRGVNIKEFNLSIKPSLPLTLDLDGIPLFLYIGKISKLKNTYSFIKAASMLKHLRFKILFLAGETRKLNVFKENINSLGLDKKVIYIPFQPPWKIPEIINQSTAVVCPENDETPFLPYGTHYPKIARETLACGKCAVIGERVAQKGLYSKLTSGSQIYIVDTTNIYKFSKVLEKIIQEPEQTLLIGREARLFSEKFEDFDGYIKEIISLFKIAVFKQKIKNNV